MRMVLNRNMKIQIIILFYLLAQGCLEDPFIIGEKISINKRESNYIMISSASIKEGSKFIYDNIEYTAVIESDKLIYVETSDSSYVSSEGFKVGDLINPNAEVNEDIGWAYYTQLNNGWYAACYSNCLFGSEQFRIQWFFKK